MSEQLRHIMINYETTPPNAVWENIASRLDDDKQYASLSTRINNFEITPPDTAWNIIAERLEDDNQYSDIAKRINNFEVTPPDAAWQNINERLYDNNHFATVSNRLNNFEAIPPPAAWDTIVERLNDDGQYNTIATKLQNFDTPPPQQVWNNIAEVIQEPVAPIINIRRTIYRIAAAAIIIGLFIGSWMFINNKIENSEVVKNEHEILPVQPNLKEENKIIKHNSAAQKEETIAAIDPSFQKNTRKHNITSNFPAGNNKDSHQLKHAVVNDLLAYQKNPIIISASPILDSYGNVIRDIDVLTTSNYIIVTGPNGQTTRISSKFANVIRYMNSNNDDPTEEYIDKVIKESDTWKKRFQQWRSKISQSSFIPSASNFLDIVEFKELIQEKQ